MSNFKDGFCRIKQSQINFGYIRQYLNYLADLQMACTGKISSGEFNREITTFKIFGREFKKTVFDREACEESFPELFKYAYIDPVRVEGTTYHVVSFKSRIATVESILKMMEVSDDIYLTPEQIEVLKNFSNRSYRLDKTQEEFYKSTSGN